MICGTMPLIMEDYKEKREQIIVFTFCGLSDSIHFY